VSIIVGIVIRLISPDGQSFRCELNRKKSKFERYRLIATAIVSWACKY